MVRQQTVDQEPVLYFAHFIENVAYYRIYKKTDSGVLLVDTTSETRWFVPHKEIGTIEEFYVTSVTGGGIESEPSRTVDVEHYYTSASEFAPERYSLGVNAWPNPFNASATLTYTVDRTTNISLEVFDILGRKVSVLHQGQTTAGVHRVSWAAEGHASGVYLVRLSTATGRQQVARVVLVR
jgi:hypothetical protein